MKDRAVSDLYNLGIVGVGGTGFGICSSDFINVGCMKGLSLEWAHGGVCGQDDQLLGLFYRALDRWGWVLGM